MKPSLTPFLPGFALALSLLTPLRADPSNSLTEGNLKATITATDVGGLRSYVLTTNADLRDNTPADKRITFAEVPEHARLRTGNSLFDGLYALAVHEALQDSVSQISDGAYGHGAPLDLQAFQTGAKWTYVWTRDLSYSTDLALAGFDPTRAANSLLFKTSALKPSALKPSVGGGPAEQIIQDTGSGGSYPVSTDRVVWSLGASALLSSLPDAERPAFLRRAYPILHDTLQQDRRLVFDPADGLYRGEQSFLDWREQTYPLWTKDTVLPIGMSKALSVNALDYFALHTAAEWAGRLGRLGEQRRYARWASALKTAINRRFYDPDVGLYSAYLFTDTDSPVRTHRYDLLGESLAILLGVAPDAWAGRIIRRYPTGPYGPPVVWPEEAALPIYHNHAIWPFVTAYWIKAARQAGNAEAVDNGISSLVRGAAFSLSNMENFDFGTGRTRVDQGVLQGPVVDSQRQVWSVAGYLSMVQDVVFGLQTSWDGVRFRPCVTAQLRDGMFASSDVIELRHFDYRGKTMDVRVHLPRRGVTGGGVCRVVRVALNGKPVGSRFVPSALLPAHSAWDIFLGPPNAGSASHSSIRRVSDGPAVFAPAQPEWEVGQSGLTLENGLLTLHYRDVAPNVSFNIYRDGQPCAMGIKTTRWTDPHSGDYANAIHFYAVEAVDAQTGNASHLTPTRFYKTEGAETILPASQMANQGGNMVAGHYFENWGRVGDELRVSRFTISRSGLYLVRAEYANGAGPVNTGITCAVKAMEIDSDSGRPVARGYLVMPQLGDWTRFELSSVIRARLKAGVTYSLRLGEDDYCRNMSYLQNNARYTAAPGGGDTAYNFVNIAGIHLLRVGN